MSACTRLSWVRTTLRNAWNSAAHFSLRSRARTNSGNLSTSPPNTHTHFTFAHALTPRHINHEHMRTETGSAAEATHRHRRGQRAAELEEMAVRERSGSEGDEWQ